MDKEKKDALTEAIDLMKAASELIWQVQDNYELSQIGCDLDDLITATNQQIDNGQ